MASRFQITDGPCKFDLLIRGLAELRPIEFVFEQRGRQEVRLQLIGPEDGSGNRWLIRGQFTTGSPPASTFHYFKGYYDVTRRRGWYEMTSSTDEPTSPAHKAQDEGFHLGPAVVDSQVELYRSLPPTQTT